MVISCNMVNIFRCDLYLGKSSLESTAIVKIDKGVLILAILRASDLKECISKCTFRKLSVQVRICSSYIAWDRVLILKGLQEV